MKITYRAIFISLISSSIILMSGCASTPSVYSDFDPRHDFTAHKNFTWVHNPPMLRAGDYPVSALAEGAITAAIKAELEAKGYSYVEQEEQADFSVVYTMGARDNIKITRHYSPYYSHHRDWGWGAYYFPYFVNFPFGRDSWFYDDIDEYTQGTIALDIFSTANKQPIWHTKAKKRLTKKELDRPEKGAQEIAKSLLKHFPEVGCVVELTRECRPFRASPPKEDNKAN